MIPLGYPGGANSRRECEKVHVLNVYLEPKPTEAVTKRRQRVLQIVDDIMRQHREAKIVVGGDING
jgi:hypothetical protein